MTQAGPEGQLKQGAWEWLLFLTVGLLSVVAGVVVIGNPSIGLTTLAVTAGVFLLVDGIAELGSSLFGAPERRALTAVVGVASAVVGILLVRHPIHGVVAVALLVGLWLIISGLVRFAWALNQEGRRARLWTMLVAVVELVGGIVIVSTPGVGVATLALLVGLSLIARGIAMCGVAWLMRRLGVGGELGDAPPSPVTVS